jgi:hypothetical protein
MIYKYKAWVGSGNEYDEDAIIQDEISSSWDPDHPRWVAEDVAKELFKEGLFEKEIKVRIYDSRSGDSMSQQSLCIHFMRWR